MDSDGKVYITDKLQEFHRQETPKEKLGPVEEHE